jgi:lysophospholipase L1-like esterase
MYHGKKRYRGSATARAMKILQAVACAALFSSPSDGQEIRVACVGNSITYGSHLPDPPRQCYPTVLQDLCGDGYEIGNFGASGACCQKNSDLPYWRETAFRAVFDFSPEIIIIMLGTNDSKPQNWQDAGTFSRDLDALIDTFLTIGTSPRVLLCLPPPVFPNDRFTISGPIIHEEIVPAVRLMAGSRGLQVIDTHEPFLDDTAFFHDGVHPDAAGAAAIAGVVYDALAATRTARCSGDGIQRAEDMSVHGGNLDFSRPQTRRMYAGGPGQARLNMFTAQGRVLNRGVGTPAGKSAAVQNLFAKKRG